MREGVNMQKVKITAYMDRDSELWGLMEVPDNQPQPEWYALIQCMDQLKDHGGLILNGNMFIPAAKVHAVRTFLMKEKL